MEDFLLTPNQNEIEVHQERLNYRGITNITACFKDDIKEILHQEISSVFNANCKRKDFMSLHTNTPRNLSIVSEREITKNSCIIKDFYYSPALLKLLSELALEKVNFLPWEGERYVINGLIKDNDTHGWHWDDYAYALVFIAESPPQGSGGYLECVANTDWIKTNPNIDHIVNTRPIQSYYFEPNNFYLMRSDTTLHRVTKIAGSYRRLSVIMSYCNQADLSKEIDHLTVYDLYG